MACAQECRASGNFKKFWRLIWLSADLQICQFKQHFSRSNILSNARKIKTNLALPEKIMKMADKSFEHAQKNLHEYETSTVFGPNLFGLCGNKDISAPVLTSHFDPIFRSFRPSHMNINLYSCQFENVDLY